MKSAAVGSNKTSGKKKRREEFGALIKAIRLRDDLSMEAVAEKAFGDAAQKSTISSLEKGEGSISIERALALTKSIAKNDTERADLITAFALHSGIVSVVGLDKGEVRRVVKLVHSLRASAKTPKTTPRVSKATTGPISGGGLNDGASAVS